jgi:hypothetical protein
MFDDEAPQQSSEMPPAAVLQAAHEDEVPDIFDGSGIDGPSMADSSPETSIHGPSALDSGKLQRVQETPSHSFEQPADLHEPTAIKRILIASVVLIVLAMIGFGVWYFVIRKPGAANTPTVVTPPAAAPAPTVPEPVVPSAPVPVPDENIVNVDATGPAKEPEPVIEKPADVPLPVLDAQKDSDKDGLTDEQEKKLGTDAANPDTDIDGLNDGAEINIWGTDPQNKDTDGDGFTDGQEVLNGFNPKGAGKAQ